MKLSLSLLTALSAILFALSSCDSEEIGESKDVNPETVFFDYKVWGDENSGDATVMLQYRFAGEHGTTLVLTDPSGVAVDGQQLKTDSSRITGAFYEKIMRVDSFEGPHSISYHDMKGKEYTEQFIFSRIGLATQVPAQIKRGDLSFELTGLDPIDYVRVVLTDTSFASPGINRLDTVHNGQVSIKASDLKDVVSGPIRLELIRENERKVKNGTKEGGKLSISYSLHRDFILQ